MLGRRVADTFGLPQLALLVAVCVVFSGGDFNFNFLGELHGFKSSREKVALRGLPASGARATGVPPPPKRRPRSVSTGVPPRPKGRPRKVPIGVPSPPKARPSHVPVGVLPSQARPRFALLIDGDNYYNVGYWERAQAAVAQHGELINSRVFAAPDLIDKKSNLAPEADRLGVQIVPVPRKLGGGKDPNDIAIGMEAARLVSRGEVDSVALLVCDADYVYLAQRINGWGHRCVIILAESGGVSVGEACEEAGIGTLWVPKADGAPATRPTMKAILDSSGETHFRTMESAERTMPSLGATRKRQIARRLYDLGFLNAADDHLLPSVAKFYHSQGMGSVTVWPPDAAYAGIEYVLATTKSIDLRKSPGDLVFVMPLATTGSTKKWLKQCGSAHCGRIFRGGGPFILKSSGDMVHQVLRRLGFLDDDLNTDVGEAIDVFIDSARNKRNLKDVDLMIDTRFDASTKKALLHAALISGKHGGQWNIAPGDTLARQWLLSRAKIKHKSASRSDVMLALRSYARQQKLPIPATYNKLVSTFERHLNGNQPSRRNE